MVKCIMFGSDLASWKWRYAGATGDFDSARYLLYQIGNMKNTIFQKLIKALMAVSLVICMAAGSVPNVHASDTHGTRQYILDLINWIRLDPVEYARGLGYDAQTLMDQNPWLITLVEQGLPMVVSREYLQLQAAARNDMSGAIPEPEPSLSQDPAETGQISGAVSFLNFVDPQAAVGFVINHQFKKELDPGFSGRRLILNPRLDVAGADFRADQSTTDGSRLAYQVMAVLGSGITRSQRQMLNLINQVRHDPTAAVRVPDYSLAQFAGRVRTPLFFHDVLQAFADTEFLRTPEYAIHAQNFGYPGLWVTRSSVLEIFPKTDADTMVSWLFSALVLKEAKGLAGGPVIFGSYYTDAGISLAFTSGQTLDHASLALVTGITEQDTPGYSRIYGMVYADANQDRVYTPGEGRSGSTVSVYDLVTFQPAATGVTDETGHFSVRLPSDRPYAFQTGEGDTLVSRDLYLTENQFFSLPVPVDALP